MTESNATENAVEWSDMMRQVKLSPTLTMGDGKEKEVLQIPSGLSMLAPVSKRKEIDFIDTRMSTWSSLSEMTVVGTREPGFLQSSMARP